MNDHISEQQLEEQRYRVLIDHAPEPVLILDAELNRFVDANPMATQILGYSKAELCGVGPAEISPPFQYGVPTKKWAEHYVNLALQGANPTFEWTHYTKLGDQIPMEVRLIRFPPYHKSLIRCSLVDLTERKAMEKALQDSQERLQLALAASGCGCYDWLPQTGELHWDERMHELHGLRLDAEMDRNDYFFSIIHEDDRERILRNLAEALSPQSDLNTFEDEFRTVVAGQVRYVVSQGMTFRNEGGEVTRVIGTNRDVTIEREREALLSSTTERLEQAQQLANIGSFETDLLEAKTWWSDGLYQIRELSPEHFTPSCRAFIEMIHPEDQPSVEKQIEFCQQHGGEQRLTYKLLLKNNRIKYFEDVLHGIKDKSGQVVRVIGTSQDVTERKIMEEALRQSKNYAENLIETANVMVVGLDTAGIVTVFNQEAQQISGYSQEELAGKDWFETLVPKEHYPEVWEAFLKTAEGELPRTFENPIRTKSGEERIISWQNSAVEDHGESIGTISFGVDITERRQALEALRDREELFHTVFEQQFQFVAILSEEGCVLEINSLPVKVMGGTREDIIGKYFWELPCWVDLPDWQQAIKERVRQAGQMTETWLTMCAFNDVHKNLHWADTAYTAIRDEEQNVRFILVQSTDITERKAAQEKLLLAQDNLSQLAERFRISTKAAQIGIWEWRINEDELIWDETMGRIYNSDNQQIARRLKDWKAFLHPDDLPHFENWIQETLTASTEQHIEFRILGANEQHQYIKAVAIVERNLDEQSVRMIGTNLDVTREKEAEQQRIRARQLEVRNDELEQFAYVASHDLQEPLRTVTSFVGLLESRYQDKLDAEANQYIDFIVSAASRMSQLIKGLLEYARIGTDGALSKVDCTALVQAVVQDLSAQISDTNATVNLGDLPNVTGYETELRVLFQNLISNALKFRRPAVAPSIIINAAREGRSTVFSISDNGIGIEPHYQQQIFVIFKRLHRREQFAGTGIGLAHCQKIVDLHGGTIWVDSEVGKGSTFYFRIVDQDTN